MRYQRMIMAEERVNKLPVKLLVPLVFFIFPSISVLLIGPAVLQMQKSMPGMMASSFKSNKSVVAKKTNPADENAAGSADLSKSIILRNKDARTLKKPASPVKKSAVTSPRQRNVIVAPVPVSPSENTTPEKTSAPILPPIPKSGN
jgi:hypothetical protein